MNRIQLIQEYVNRVISEVQFDDEKRNAYIHTFGVAQCCSLLAERRGLNTELAYIIGLLHDVYAYYTGSHMYHSQSGADMVRVAIRNMDFSEEEKIIIQSAVYHHANKDLVHDEYDEVLKDADILQNFLNDAGIKISRLARTRLEKMLKSLNIRINRNILEYGWDNINKSTVFCRSKIADIAEVLASKKICGEKNNADFIALIRYFPEITAFEELTHAWCAAFVYHCVIKAGLSLPIRDKPTSNTRFACVYAWLKWGQENNFCFFEKDGFSPLRGDIVIYNNIISKENRPKNTPWHDHIGIVLSVENSKIIVAEGNVDNKNISGIVERMCNQNIGCYVRIPNEYKYDGWKYDYKTSEIRVKNYE